MSMHDVKLLTLSKTRRTQNRKLRDIDFVVSRICDDHRTDRMAVDVQKPVIETAPAPNNGSEQLDATLNSVSYQAGEIVAHDVMPLSSEARKDIGINTDVRIDENSEETDKIISFLGHCKSSRIRCSFPYDSTSDNQLASLLASELYGLPDEDIAEENQNLAEYQDLKLRELSYFRRRAMAAAGLNCN